LAAALAAFAFDFFAALLRRRRSAGGSAAEGGPIAAWLTNGIRSSYASGLRNVVKRAVMDLILALRRFVFPFTVLPFAALARLRLGALADAPSASISSSSLIGGIAAADAAADAAVASASAAARSAAMAFAAGEVLIDPRAA
jgi:hypothetical protein